jgi:hypothetical protein
MPIGLTLRRVSHRPGRMDGSVTAAAVPKASHSGTDIKRRQT